MGWLKLLEFAQTVYGKRVGVVKFYPLVPLALAGLVVVKGLEWWALGLWLLSIGVWLPMWALDRLWWVKENLKLYEAIHLCHTKTPRVWQDGNDLFVEVGLVLHSVFPFRVEFDAERLHVIVDRVQAEAYSREHVGTLTLPRRGRRPIQITARVPKAYRSRVLDKGVVDVRVEGGVVVVWRKQRDVIRPCGDGVHGDPERLVRIGD